MTLLLKNLAFTILVPGTIAVVVPLFLIPHGSAAVTPVTWLGPVLVAAGSMIYAWCAGEFALTGRGTPAPIDPPGRLVIRGPYRYVRNPMYLGVLCVIAGWALLFLSLPLALYGLGVAVCFHLFITLYEEPHLRRVFGPSYQAYCRSVGRWLPARWLRTPV